MAAITLPEILDTIRLDNVGPGVLPRSQQGSQQGLSGLPALFASGGKHGEFALLDQHLLEVLDAQDKIVPLTAETAASHALSLLSYILSIQLDPTNESHFWTGRDVVRALGAALSAEPKDRTVWVDGVDPDALAQAVATISAACRSEFLASVSLRNQPFHELMKTLRRRAPGSIGLLFIGENLIHSQIVQLHRVVPKQLAVGGFLALPAATAALPPVVRGLPGLDIHAIGTVAGHMTVYQRVAEGQPARGAAK